MSCILRASGKNFAVEEYVKDKDIEFTQVYKKGEPRFPNSKVIDQINQFSGIGIEVSDADMSDMTLQIEDATHFLQSNQNLISELVSFDGVENVELDFGVESKPPFWTSYTLPPELITHAANLGLGICISTYPCDEEEA